jgi:hypothetical protein
VRQALRVHRGVQGRLVLRVRRGYRGQLLLYRVRRVLRVIRETRDLKAFRALLDRREPPVNRVPKGIKVRKGTRPPYRVLKDRKAIRGFLGMRGLKGSLVSKVHKEMSDHKEVLVPRGHRVIKDPRGHRVSRALRAIKGIRGFLGMRGLKETQARREHLGSKDRRGTRVLKG